jgi:replicative DNA helicase
MSEDGAAMTTGYKQLDEAMGGFFDSDLIIIPARPAMGKTACLLNIILRCGGTPGVISAEQGHDQMGIRTVCIGGKINHHKFRTGQLEEEDWTSMTASIMKFKERNGRIYDKPAPTMLEIEKIARRWVYKNGVDILFIDYAQRISHEDKRMPRWQQNTDIAMRLKELARTLNIPVVALAQVNRDCEKRPSKRPEMGDIADASAYEKEADAIITLYRDEVYNEDTPDRGVLEMDFKKNRHGPIGVIRMKWEGQYMRVDDFTDYEQRQPEPIVTGKHLYLAYLRYKPHRDKEL